jgi:hypothetical protein
MAVSLADRVVAVPDVLVRAVGDESVLLQVATETYFGLDAVGTRMWRALVEAPSIQDARDVLLAEYEVGADDLQRDLDTFISELIARELITLEPAA